MMTATVRDAFIIFIIGRIGPDLIMDRGGTLASHPEAPGLIPGVPELFSDEKLSMLVRLINSAG